MYKNYYYFIEDLDVTNDNLPDGVLVRQYKIDKKRNIYHYIKNSYITDDNLVKIIDDVVIQNQNNSDNKLLNTKHSDPTLFFNNGIICGLASIKIEFLISNSLNIIYSDAM